jgi:hypothetical protein
MSGSVGNAGGLRHGRERLVVLKVWLEQSESLHRQFPGFFGKAGQLVHTQRVCQIQLTRLCQIILRVASNIFLPFCFERYSMGATRPRGSWLESRH